MLSKKCYISNIELSLKIAPINLVKTEKGCDPTKHPTFIKGKRYPNYLKKPHKGYCNYVIWKKSRNSLKTPPKTACKHHFNTKSYSSL